MRQSFNEWLPFLCTGQTSLLFNDKFDVLVDEPDSTRLTFSAKLTFSILKGDLGVNFCSEATKFFVEKGIAVFSDLFWQENL